jgi:uncharacterized damage-inducible protein DinB
MGRDKFDLPDESTSTPRLPARRAWRSALLQTLTAAPQRIVHAVDGLAAEALTGQVDPESWSAHMTLSHLAHAEPLFRWRLACILEEADPLLPAFGPDEALPRSDRSFDELVAVFYRERQQTLALLYGLPESAWARPARHEKQGETTLRGQVQVIIDHDTAHLGQLHDVCQQWHDQHQPSTLHDGDR